MQLIVSLLTMVVIALLITLAVMHSGSDGGDPGSSLRSGPTQPTEPSVFYMALHMESQAGLKDACEETWLAHSNDPYVFLVGGGEDKDPQIDGTLLKVPVPETFENITLKTYWGMKWALQVKGWTHLCRTNNGTYFQTDMVKGLCCDPSLVLGGHVKYHTRDHEYFVSGCNMLFSRKAVETIAAISADQVPRTRSLGDDRWLTRAVCGSLNVLPRHLPYHRVLRTQDEVTPFHWCFRLSDPKDEEQKRLKFYSVHEGLSNGSHANWVRETVTNDDPGTS